MKAVISVTSCSERDCSAKRKYSLFILGVFSKIYYCNRDDIWANCITRDSSFAYCCYKNGLMTCDVTSECGGESFEGEDIDVATRISQTEAK